MLDNTVEHAFELAASGKFRSVDEIRNQLRRERASNFREHLAGLLIRGQLQARMRSRLADRNSAPGDPS